MTTYLGCNYIGKYTATHLAYYNSQAVNWCLLILEARV